MIKAGAKSDSPSTKGGVKARRPKGCAPEQPALTGRFAALDFETADYGRDSACALSIVIVKDDAVVSAWSSLIRPPRSSFVFTYLHGISWSDVKNKPMFGDLWPEIDKLLAEVDFIAAHNAPFDRSVLNACCQGAAASLPKKPFVCTVKVARALWNLRPTKLSDVCRHLKIPLKHHDAASDALACARILLAARQQGHEYPQLLKKHALRAA